MRTPERAPSVVLLAALAGLVLLAGLAVGRTG
jgi:hypothetical protein